jgi:hypothetical protein
MPCLHFLYGRWHYGTGDFKDCSEVVLEGAAEFIISRIIDVR